MREGLDGPISYLEFGVSRGDSIRWWVENNRPPERTFVGFDSFEGLPEHWGGWSKGSFSANGDIPGIADQGCSFVKGLCQDTVPSELAGHELCRRTVMHLDADLYTSTLLALTQLLPKVKAGSVIIFNEFSDYLHECRAWFDAAAAHRLSFVPLCHTPGWGQVAFQLT